MTPRGRRALLGAAGIAALPVAALGQGGLTDHAAAGRIFGSAIARCYGVEERGVAVSPDGPLPPQGSEVARLRVRGFHAYSAIFAFRGQPATVRGFASRTGGAAFVTLRDALDRPVGIAPVLIALGMDDPGRAAPLPKIVARVVWAWRGPGEPAEHPDMPWGLDRDGEATVLRFVMLEAGRTGSLVTHAVRVVLMRGQGSRIEPRQVPTPGILPRPVVLDPVPIGA